MKPADRARGVSRREVLRVGGASLLGLSLVDLLAGRARAQSAAAASPDAAKLAGDAKAKNVILLYLQGGPSHLDLWDPKDGCPADVQSVYKRIKTKVDGIDLTENLPKLAQVTDKLTLIRSMSYAPNGLFNHTAAIYQMLTGWTADKVSPSGQLEPPSPKDFPNFGCELVRLLPTEVPMLPFVMMPRPLQESSVIGKAGTAGFLGRAFDPYYLFPPGDDFDPKKLTFRQAMEGSEKDKWVGAIDEEVQNLIRRQTFSGEISEADLQGKEVVDAKLVFDYKKDKDGRILRYKARLVARGFTQKHGVNYGETFAPTIRLDAMRIILALAAKKGWKVHQMDAGGGQGFGGLLGQVVQVRLQCLRAQRDARIPTRHPRGRTVKGEIAPGQRLHQRIQSGQAVA